MYIIFNNKSVIIRRIITVAAAVMLAFSIGVAYAAPKYNYVTITDGDCKINIYTEKNTVSDVIKEQGIKLGKGVVTEPSGKAEISDAMKITVKRYKEVSILENGITTTYWTDRLTYRDFFKENGIKIDESDSINVDVDDKLKKGNNKIIITKVGTVTEEVEEKIPYETVAEYDSTLPSGSKIVKIKGEDGLKKVKYISLYHDSAEVSRVAADETVIKEAVNEIVVFGTGELPQQTNVDPSYAPSSYSGSAGGSSAGANTILVNGTAYSYKKVLTCTATAYDLSYESTGKKPGQSGYGITASGTYCKKGTVAVDPSVIPLGTKMYIVSSDGSVVYGLCTAEDTGGAIKGNKVDLYYDTRAECLKFGRRSVDVYILE